jgi:hypothetical protein
MGFLIFLSVPSFAQNTKGDKAEVSSSRQTRFKGKPSKKAKGKQSYNRVTANPWSLANSARSFNRARIPSGGGKANIFPQHGPFVNNPSPYPKNTQRPVSNKKTLATLNRLQGSPKAKSPGRKPVVVPRSASTSFIRHKTINANAGFWNVRRKGEQAVTTDLAGKPLRTKNFRTPPREVIPQTSPYKRIKKNRDDKPYSGPTNTAYLPKPHATQKAWRGDIAGGNLRSRNFSSTKNNGPGEGRVRGTRPRSNEFYSRGVIPGGGYRSRSGPGEKRPGKEALPAKVPGIGALGVNYSGRSKGYRPVKGGGSRSGRHWNNNGFALQPKSPGIGANGVASFQGNVKSVRPVKGGGSISGRSWNNKRTPVGVRIPPAGAERVAGFPGRIQKFQLSPGFQDQGEGFTGYTKRGRPVKGGGSKSGKHWNNGGFALQPRSPGMAANGLSSQGNLKGGKPIKGGGSRSGKHWNNNGFALQPRIPLSGDERPATFQGNIKGGKPVKGGGSVSGRVWNNKGFPIQPRIPSGGEAVGTFQGNIKAKRPVKGGGSISGRLWNNKQSAISSKWPSDTQQKSARWQGDRMIFDQSPLFENQGEEFTGYIKLPKFKKAYKQNPKAHELSTLKRRPNDKADEIEDLKVKVERRKYITNKDLPEEATRKLKPTEVTTGIDNLKIKVERRKYVVNKNSAELALKKLKPTPLTKEIDNLTSKVERRKYVVNKNSAEEALKKLKPTATTRLTDNLTTKVERRRYVVNKNSADLALKKLKPTDATKEADNLTAKVKQYHYMHNSSSSKEALDVREPGKAFAKATDYQGNVKMKKFELAKLFSERNRKLHPDAQFIQINKNNVKEERSLLTNVRLWWARNFRKSKNQPEHLKEREHKPRYDKGEDGMWNE